MKLLVTSIIVCTACILSGIGLSEVILAQDAAPPSGNSLKVKSPGGWVTVHAASPATFAVDGDVVFVEGISAEPMSFSVTDQGVLLVQCQGWNYETSAPFTMRKDGKTFVKIELGGARPARAAAADDEDEGTFPSDRIKVVGQGPIEDEPEPAAKEPAAATPKGD